MRAVIDSGSKCNIIDEGTWTKMKGQKVVVKNKNSQSDRSFKAYGGHQLTVLGTFEATLAVRNKKNKAKFYVVKGVGKPLIGRDSAKELSVLMIDTGVHDINAVEDRVNPHEFAKIKGVTVEIPIRADAKPVIQPYRRVPIPLEKAVDEQIDDLLRQGIIEKVDGPSKWVSPLVVVPKQNGSPRICVDMRRANEAIDRENHPLPTFDDFLPHLAQAEVFSKLDIKSAYHQVKL